MLKDILGKLYLFFEFILDNYSFFISSSNNKNSNQDSKNNFYKLKFS